MAASKPRILEFNDMYCFISFNALLNDTISSNLNLIDSEIHEFKNSLICIILVVHKSWNRRLSQFFNSAWFDHVIVLKSINRCTIFIYFWNLQFLINVTIIQVRAYKLYVTVAGCVLWCSCSQILLYYLAVQSFYHEYIWWRVF